MWALGVLHIESFQSDKRFPSYIQKGLGYQILWFIIDLSHTSNKNKLCSMFMNLHNQN